MKILSFLNFFLRTINGLSTETKFLFHLDFASRHFADRLTEIHTVLNLVKKLRRETGQDWIFVGTQLQFTHQNRLPDVAIPLMKLLDTDLMERELPFLTWDGFLKYIGMERGLHEDDKPTIIFDRILELQRDSKTAEILLSEENEDTFITHSSTVSRCYDEPKKSKSGRYKKDFWDLPGLTAENYSCIDIIGSAGSLVKIMADLDDRLVVLSSKMCEDCFEGVYSDEGDESDLLYEDFWNSWKYLEFAQSHREIANEELDARMGSEVSYIGLIWYSHWSERNQKYVEEIREKTGLKNILSQTLLQDRDDLNTWREKLDELYWSTNVNDKKALVTKAHDVQIRDLQMMVRATDFFGLYGDNFTRLVFVKRALNGAPDDKNFKYSCLSFKCETGFYQDGEFPRPKNMRDEL